MYRQSLKCQQVKTRHLRDISSLTLIRVFETQTLCARNKHDNDAPAS